MKIIIERNKCIGCGSCVQVCPKIFEMKEDGRAGLKKERTKKGRSSKEVLGMEAQGCAEEAAKVCPVQCIIIKN